MSVNINKILLLIGIVAAVFCFVCFDPFFHGPDEPVYFSGVEALAQNGDMNIAPGMFRRGAPMWNTVTGNYPDFHNNGALVLWLPSFVFGKTVYGAASLVAPLWAQSIGAELFARCALSGLTLVLGLGLLFGCFVFCSRFVSRFSALLAVAALFMATPFFHYLLFDSGNANVPAALFCLGMVWALFECEKFSSGSWLLYGLFMSLALAVKSELWLYFGLSGLVFCRLLFKRAITLRALVWFGAGFVFVLGLRMINAYIRFGTVHLEEVIYFRSFFEYQDTYSFNGLFSRFRGIIYTSPVLVLCVCGFFAALAVWFRALKKKTGPESEKFLLLVLPGAFVMLKLFAVGRIFSPAGDGLSFRVLISDIPVLILLASLFINYLPRPGKVVAAVFCAAACGWNFFVYSGYLCSLEWRFLALDGVDWCLYRDAARAAALYVFSAKGLGVKLIQLAALSGFAGLGILVKRRAGLLFFGRNFLRTAVVLCSCIYFTATSLNIAFNSANIKELKNDGFFHYSTLMSVSAFEMTELEREQHLYTLMNMYRFLLFAGQNEQAQKLYEGRVRIFGTAQIPVDKFALPFSKLAARCMENGDSDNAEELLLKTKEYAPHNWEALMLVGDILMAGARDEDAVLLFRQALELNPSASPVLTRLSEYYGKTGRYDLAAEYIRKDIALNPGNIDHYKTLAVFYRKQGLKKEEESALKAVLELNPTDAGTRRELCSLLVSVGDYGRALEELAQAPEDRGALMLKAEIFRVNGDADSEILVLEKLRDGNSASVLKRLCELYFDRGENDRALKFAAAFEKEGAGSVSSNRLMGKIYFESGDFGRALPYLEKTVASVGREGAGVDSASLENLARSQYALGKADEALESYRKLVAGGVKKTEVFFRLGELFFRKGDNNEAVKNLELAGDDENSLRLLAEVYRAAGRPDEARKIYVQLISAFPDALDIRVQKAEMEYLLGDYELAAEEYCAVQALRPEDRMLARRTISAMSKAGRTQDAAQLAQKLLAGAGAKERESLLLELGQLYLSAGDTQTAERYFKDVLTVNAASVAAYKLLAGLYAGQGADRKAADCYGKITQLAPSSGNWLAFARYSRACGDSVSAVSGYEKAFEDEKLKAVFDDRLDYTEELLRVGRLSDAVAVGEALLEKNAQKIPAALCDLLVRVYEGLAQEAKKTDILERYIKNEPEDYLRLVELARAYHACGKAARACAVFARACGLDRARVDVLGDYASALIDNGAFEEAEKIYGRMLELDSGNARAMDGLILVYDVAGSNEKRIETLLRYLKNFPDDYQHRVKLAQAYEKNGRAGMAAQVYEQIARMNPSSPQPLWRLGDMYISEGQYEKARAAYERALAMGAGGRLESLRKLAMVCDKLGDLETRLVLLDEIMGMTDVTPAFLIEYAQTLVSAGKLKDALSWYERARKSIAEDEQIEYEYGQLCMRLGLFEKARENFVRQFVLRPKSEDLCQKLVELSERVGDKLSEIKYLEQRFVINPKAPVSVRKHLGDIYVGLGRNEDAARTYKAVLERDPNDEYALRRLAWIYETEKDYKQALTYLSGLEVSGRADEEISARIKTLNEELSKAK